MTPPARSVVVIGAGLAGLTAALDLADAGWAVQLVEASARLGGHAGSAMRDGLPIDTGQHVFLRCCTAYRGLLERIGASHLTRLQDRLRVPVLLAGGSPPGATPEATSSGEPVACALAARRGLPARLALAPALLGYPALHRAERLTAARALLALGRLDPADPAVDAQRFGDWLAAHGQGARAVAGLWELLTVATLNTPVAEASLALAAVVVQDGLLAGGGAADIGWATAPLAQLHDTAARAALAAAGVRLRTSTKVLGVEATPAGVRMRLRDGELDASSVVVATQSAATARLLPQLELTALPDSPIVNVHLRYDRRVAELAPDAPFTATVDPPPSGYSIEPAQLG